jgi:N-acetylglucosaminyldiphosphoundecaprenol N-acetyl-beta-D-mannosaminyltransferase
MFKLKLFNFEFTNLDYSQVLQALPGMLTEPRFNYLITLNPEILLAAQTDPRLAADIKQARHIFADGTGLIFANRLFNRQSLQRITGSDLTPLLLAQSRRCYFWGAKPEIIEAAVKNIKQQYLQCQVVGHHHGYFNTTQETQIIVELKKLRPDFVFLGLGAPKQERLLNKLSQELDYGIGIGIGGVFDILSGHKQRAPLLWQKLCLEWLYRGLIEPRRMMRWWFIPRFIFFTISFKIKSIIT